MNYKKIIGIILALPLIISVVICLVYWILVLGLTTYNAIPTINPMFFYVGAMFILFFIGIVLYNWDDKNKGGFL